MTQKRSSARKPLVPSVPSYTKWPRIKSSILADPQLEARIDKLLAGMTLAQKVGQMTQADIRSVTPDEVRKHYLGSVLNGGGAWPDNDKHAAIKRWVEMADAYWEASMSTDMAVRIPIIWGTDAVHGHGNVFAATIFPHNIGLGAAADPELIYRIGAATAQQVWATGIEWTFAPTLAVVRDDRWGRTYESYSEHPRLVRDYATAMVRGLQGEDFTRAVRVLACAKHYIGDGGTLDGIDQGVNAASEDELRALHAQGYFTALAAGAQTVMASFNSWSNAALGIREGKLHGSHYLLTEVLKEAMGFDGFVVSDWNGVGQVEGCSNFSCAAAINAGIDMVMVPTEWREFITHTIAQVEAGEIPLARIDDAVRRILRVKLRAGIFELARPARRDGAGDPSWLLHRELAREAVRKSLVLLKNQGATLPLKRAQKVLVVGKCADDLGCQAGGWSLTWQGTTNTNADFPHADSVLASVREVCGADNVVFSADASGVRVADFDVVIAVIGETPYAEGVGDIGAQGNLEHAQRYPEDLAVLQAVAGHGVAVVTLLFSGRPLWVNREINLSDAFVLAWLPGSEGRGITDVLFEAADGSVAHDFVGRLAFSWPARAAQVAVNVGDADYAPQFAYGAGLSLGDACRLGKLDESGLGAPPPAQQAALPIFQQSACAPYQLTLGTAATEQHTISADLNARYVQRYVCLETAQVSVQQDAKRIEWLGGGGAGLVAHSASPRDLSAYLGSEAALVLELIVHSAPSAPLLVAIGNRAQGLGAAFDISATLSALSPGKHSLILPLAAFAAGGADFTAIDTPFALYSEGRCALSIAKVRWEPGMAKDSQALKLG